MLVGQKCASDTVRQWLGQQPVSFFASGVQKHVDIEQMFEQTWTICWKIKQ